MSLKDALERLPKSEQIGPKCSTCAKVKEMPPEEVATLNAMLDNERLTSSWIAEQMTLEGWPTNEENLNRHRKLGHR